jgi:hypothetical protein
MKIRILFGLAVMCGALTSAVMLLVSNQTPPLQLRFDGAPAAQATPTQPSDMEATATAVSSSLRVLGAPRQPSFSFDSPTPTPLPIAASAPLGYVPDLNIDHQFYSALGLSLEQSQSLFALRCTPAEPPLKPYPYPLEGCGPEASGIVVLDQIVSAGIMTEDEVIELLAGKVVQVWR